MPTYRESGVDIDAGNEAVSRISKIAAGIRHPHGALIDQGIGGFAGAMRLPPGSEGARMVACTDGVGTKLLLAIETNRHNTIGIDAVAMNVNDLICTGATPLFVLDYIACGTLVPAHIEAIVQGIAAGCEQSHCALLGGETAEMPGLYAKGHYDLAAFAVGIVHDANTLGPSRVQAGDVVVGLPSSGLHSNGFSLARKALLRSHGGGDAPDALLDGRALMDHLLEPTRIYVDALASVRTCGLHGAAHITGGGLLENPQRALAQNLAVRLDLDSIPSQPIFERLRGCGIAEAEMLRTFNCGVGMLLFFDPACVDDALGVLASDAPFVMGEVVVRHKDAVVLTS